MLLCINDTRFSRSELRPEYLEKLFNDVSFIASCNQFKFNEFARSNGKISSAFNLYHKYIDYLCCKYLNLIKNDVWKSDDNKLLKKVYTDFGISYTEGLCSAIKKTVADLDTISLTHDACKWKQWEEAICPIRDFIVQYKDLLSTLSVGDNTQQLTYLKIFYKVRKDVSGSSYKIPDFLNAPPLLNNSRFGSCPMPALYLCKSLSTCLAECDIKCLTPYYFSLFHLQRNVKLLDFYHTPLMVLEYIKEIRNYVESSESVFKPHFFWPESYFVDVVKSCMPTRTGTIFKFDTDKLYRYILNWPLQLACTIPSPRISNMNNDTFYLFTQAVAYSCAILESPSISGIAYRSTRVPFINYCSPHLNYSFAFFAKNRCVNSSSNTLHNLFKVTNPIKPNYYSLCNHALKYVRLKNLYFIKSQNKTLAPAWLDFFKRVKTSDGKPYFKTLTGIAEIDTILKNGDNLMDIYNVERDDQKPKVDLL